MLFVAEVGMHLIAYSFLSLVVTERHLQALGRATIGRRVQNLWRLCLLLDFPLVQLDLGSGGMTYFIVGRLVLFGLLKILIEVRGFLLRI